MRPASSQSRLRHERRKQRRTAILLLLIAGSASLLFTGCGASDRDEGMALFPPVEQTTLQEAAWLATGDKLFKQRDASLKTAWWMRLGSATDLKHFGAPYVFEQIVPKA
jgi:hypothetical protein